MINYNAVFLNTLEYLKIQKMSLIPNTLFNEDDVMELKTVNEKGELFKIVIDLENQYGRIEKILEETREVGCLDFEIFKMTLEQEPCEDAVSRKAVINALDKRFDSIPVGQTTEILLLRKDLRELPSVTPTGWITVSERMPKPNETEHLIAKYYLVQNVYGDMMVARWDGKGWEQMYQPNSYLEDDVIAWTPLPSPYELQESEDD